MPSWKLKKVQADMKPIDLDQLPETSNGSLVDLGRPKSLTLSQFEALPVSPEDLARRQQIYALEALLHSHTDSYLDHEQESAGLVLTHRFAGGVYHRELYIPPGQVVMGKRHANEHMVMLTTGSCVVVTERGRETMTAPMSFISPAGEKRVVLTLDEGCTWVVIHATQETDLDAIEREVIIQEPQRAQYYQQLRQQSLAAAVLNTKELSNDVNI